MLKAAQNAENIREEAYVYLPGVPGGDAVANELGVDYFAVPLDFGPGGAEKAHGIGSLSEYEQNMLTTAVEQLKGNIENGVKFMASQ